MKIKPITTLLLIYSANERRLRIMKLLVLCFMLSVFHAAGSIYSQNTSFNLNKENISVGEALQTIEDNSEYRFLYRSDMIDLNRLVSLNGTDLQIEDLLSIIFPEDNASFRVFEDNLIAITTEHFSGQQQNVITGIVTDAATGEPLPGASIIVQGTTIGTVTGLQGEFSLRIPDRDAVLVFSYVGYHQQDILVGDQDQINIALKEDVRLLDEIVVVGYGVQKRSDITGTVASLGQERLEMVPNLNIAQAIQGAIPGVMIQTTSAGARPSQAIIVRGRNSITADNSPLVIVDGIPYSGNLSDINPNDVESIEILKDASAAAIYGSRGSNGVILISTKEGHDGEQIVSYNGRFSTQNFVNLPDIMDGDEFYQFKMERFADGITQSETDVYESGNWVDWLDEGLRHGSSNEHTLSVSGGFGNTTYYLGGGFLDISGLALNDNFERISGRINVDTRIKDWLTIGTRTQYTNEDRSGSSPSVSGLFFLNPLTTVRDDEGNLNLYPWPEESGYFDNPLEPLLYEDSNTGNRLITNNFAVIDFPFIEGLTYRLNTGVNIRNTDRANYRGRNTKSGLNAGGRADLERGQFQDVVIENQLSYNREFNQHTIFATAVVSYEEEKGRVNYLSARGFPNDLLSFYSSAQADISTPGFSYFETTLTSQMLRLNYGYDSRYLVTLTTRRDGYSGFGADTKWGVFPSIALAWNIANEAFFPWAETFNEVKPRISWGWNGNQAVNPFQSMALLRSQDMVDDKSTLAGFVPATLAQETLGWEESRTLNAGLDLRLFENRIITDFNYYRTSTTDLLLNRTIPSIHGITSIIQNIGETKNTGFEFSVRSRNVNTNGFLWTTSANLAYVKNEIVDLYGTGVDDPANAWFIGKPIRVNYNFVVDGVWQLDEAEEAAEWGSQPGFVKIRDVDGDEMLTGDDRQVIGQQDPKTLWGMTNLFSYNNFGLEIFIHGVHGVTRFNGLKTDDETFSTIRRNTTKKNWWTPDNPTNEFPMNHLEAERMSGIRARWYEDASFIRVKDISLSYDLPADLIQGIGMNNLRLYVTGRNLFTFTQFGGVDPELSSSSSTIPLQREFVFGMNLNF